MNLASTLKTFSYHLRFWRSYSRFHYQKHVVVNKYGLSITGKTTYPLVLTEFFTDYWIVLISRVRQDDECDKVYSVVIPHPLSALQLSSQTHILGCNLTLVSDEVLERNPFETAEYLVTSIKVAVAVQILTHQVGNNFLLFGLFSIDHNEKITPYRVATLRVGESIHCACNAPFGSGTFLLSAIYKDNRRNTINPLTICVIGKSFHPKSKIK